MCDLIIYSGMVLDGTGKAAEAADIAVTAGRITKVGEVPEARCARKIDASGKFVAPGFIEEHSHADVTLLVDPRAQSMIRQGVTTLAVGHCGMSAAPIPAKLQEEYRRGAPCYSFEGYEWRWETMGQYLDALRVAQPSLNVMSMVGHMPVRLAVVGAAGNRPATPQERTEMRQRIEEALDQGARGLTTGLNLHTCGFADTTEIIDLLGAVRQRGGVYHTHMRDYGPQLLDSIRESITAAERAEVPLVISHMYPSGRDHWGQAQAAIDLVESARGRGLDVGFDVTPWLRGGAGLDQMLPPWVKEGGTDGIIDCIRDPETRARLATDLQEVGGWPGWLRLEWDDLLVCHVGKPKHRSWIGQTIADLAVQRGQSPCETALLMFAEDEGQYWIAGQNKCDADIDLLLSHPLGVPIADGLALSPEGPLAWQDRPNSYGTFPRVLGYYVRERGLLTWEEAVRKMTAIPAQRLGLADRGVIADGRVADLVVFDPATVESGADYQHPQDFPRGVEWVLVGGEVTVSPEGHTGAAAGEVL
jgi:N-acyl-D-amino-acid deacylase